MYGFEYEYAVLACLRVLKYMQLYRPKAAESFISENKESWGNDLFSDVYAALFDLVDCMESVYDESDGSEVILITDGAFSGFIKLSCMLNGHDLPAARTRFEDAVDFFFSDRSAGINDITFRYHDESANLCLYSFEGYWEIENLAFALVDLLLYLQRMNEAMRKQVKRMEEKILTLPQNTEKEAA